MIVHGFEANYAAKTEKMGYAIAVALEILQQVEGYDHYDEMVQGFAHVFECAENAAQSVGKVAEAWPRSTRTTTASTSSPPARARRSPTPPPCSS